METVFPLADLYYELKSLYYRRFDSELTNVSAYLHVNENHDLKINTLKPKNSSYSSPT